jgi:hypothetical protein
LKSFNKSSLSTFCFFKKFSIFSTTDFYSQKKVLIETLVGYEAKKQEESPWGWRESWFENHLDSQTEGRGRKKPEKRGRALVPL